MGDARPIAGEGTGGVSPLLAEIIIAWPHIVVVVEVTCRIMGNGVVTDG